MIRSFVILLCCWVLLSSLLVSCGKRAAPGKTPPPAAYYPEQFADIPLPPGYMRKDGVDQVAITFGGGHLRHFDITLIETGATESKSGPDLLKWYKTVLISNGWAPHPNRMLPHSALEFQKDNHGHTETLRLRTGRDEKLGIIRLRFVTK